MYLKKLNKKSVVFAVTEEHPEGADRGGEATVEHEIVIEDGELIYDISHNAHPDSNNDWLDLDPVARTKRGVTGFLEKEAKKLGEKAKALRALAKLCKDAKKLYLYVEDEEEECE